MDEKIQAIRRMRLQYEAAVELVQALRSTGVVVRAVCPKCGAEGSISVLISSGYSYLVVRHPDKSTHAVPKSQVGEVLPVLCNVKKNLEQILELYKKHEKTGTICADGRTGAACPEPHSSPAAPGLR